jgi:hypothetical protein
MTSTDSTFYSSFQPESQVTWTCYPLEALPNDDISSFFVLSQAAHHCNTPDYDESYKLFGLHQKAPPWACFSAPPELAAASLRCFQKGKILNIPSQKLSQSIELLTPSADCKETMLKCLTQLEKLNKMSEELYHNIFKFKKS